MPGIDNASAGGSSGATSAPNKLAAAIFALQQYYILMGRNDLVGIVGDISGVDAQQKAKIEKLNTAIQEKNSLKTVPFEVVQALMFTLIDNTEGAYFTKDLLTDTGLLSRFEPGGAQGSKKYDGIEKYVQIVYESPDNFDHGIDAPFYIKDARPSIVSLNALSGWASGDDEDNASIRNLITTSTVSPVPTGEKDENGEPKYKTELVDCKFTQLNKNPRNPDKFDSPCLSAFMFPNHRMSPAIRGAGAVSLFTNSIPTVEMSRCVPYINIRFISAVPSELGKKTGQISLIRFLGMGDDDPDDNTFSDNIGLEGALPQKLLSEYNGATLTRNIDAKKDSELLAYSTALSSAGMELFTSPQTLVNAEINREGYTGNSQTTLNPFAPFLTLNSLRVTISGLGNALHCNKTGTLSFTLHDRSRMPDIAPLIAPSLFGHTYLQVEFGWSHPDDDPSENAYGALINSMRGSQQFNIQSSDFSIENDGQVKIDMRIAARGASEIRMFPIVTGNVMPLSPFKSIIESQMTKINTQLIGKDFDDTSLKEIRNKITISTTSANSPATVISRTTWDTFMKFLKPGEGGLTSEEMKDAIDKLVGVLDSTNQEIKGGEIYKSAESFRTEVEFKLRQLEETNDPFYPTKIEPEVTQSGKDLISLGKVIMSFIGAPLAATTKFDEVQVMFYRFNSQAGAARYLGSIANFLVDVDELAVVVGEYASNNPSMSIAGFINFINSNLIAKPDNINYGLADLYTKLSEARLAGEGVDKEDKNTQEDIQNNIKAVNDEIERALQRIYSRSGKPCTPEFKIPRLSIMLEAMPAFTKEDDGPFSVDPTKTILRVHIMDLKASPHESEMFLHNVMNNSEIAAKIKTNSSTAYSEAQSAQDPQPAPPPDQTNNDEGLLKSDGVTNIADDVKEADKSDYEVIVSGISNKEIKRIIKQTVPSLTFGLGYTALNSFSLRSTTTGPVGNVLLLNSITPSKSSAVEPKNKTSNFEDVTVYPASANIDMLGCPLLEYGQQFFVDLDTGTTADNIYRITQIDHSLTAGEFRTSATLSFNSSGTIKTMRSMLKTAQLGLLKQVETEKK